MFGTGADRVQHRPLEKGADTHQAEDRLAIFARLCFEMRS